MKKGTSAGQQRRLQERSMVVMATRHFQTAIYRQTSGAAESNKQNKET